MVDIDEDQICNNDYAQETILGDIQHYRFAADCFDLVMVTLANLEAFAKTRGFEVIYRKEYESPRFPEMRARKPRLAGPLDTAAIVMNFLIPGKLDVRRGDYHVVLKKH